MMAMTPLLDRVAVGTPVIARIAGGWQVTRTRHVANLRLDAHRHAHANLVCLVRGSYEETIGRTTHACGGRSVVVKPAGEEHSNRYGARGADCVIVEALPPTLRQLGGLATLFDSVSHLREPATALLTQELCAELAGADSASSLTIESLAIELVARAARLTIRERATTAVLQRARDFLHANFQENVTLSSLADAVGRHSTHVARMFRREHGCSVGAYVRRLRLDRAASELVESDRPISTIAVDTGFYDHPHFCRLFKARFGMAPAEFRAKSRSR